MKGQYKYIRNSKPIVEVAIVGFVLVTLSCKLDATAQGCSLDLTGDMGTSYAGDASRILTRTHLCACSEIRLHPCAVASSLQDSRDKYEPDDGDFHDWFAVPNVFVLPFISASCSTLSCST